MASIPRRRWAVAAVLAVAVMAGEAAVVPCTSDAECAASTCADARPGDFAACSDATCDAVSHRCLCPGAAVLRRSGGCQEAVGDTAYAAEGCAARPQYDVRIVVGIWKGPETRAWSVTDVNGPFFTILQMSLGAALSRSPKEVVIENINRVDQDQSSAQLGDLAGSASGLMLFDWAFRFCIATGDQSPLLDAYDFEHKFSVTAQDYAAFAQATLRMLELNQPPSLVTTRRPFQILTTAPPSTPAKDGRAWLDVWWWVPWAGAGLVLVLIPATWCYCRHRHQEMRRLKRAAAEDAEARRLAEQFIQGPEGSLLRWLPEQPPLEFNVGQIAEDGASAVREPPAENGGTRGVALAQAQSAFAGPAEVEPDDPAANHCLAVETGELLEVFAAGCGWLYGRRCAAVVAEAAAAEAAMEGGGVAAEPPAGFFPERCVDWLGNPVFHDEGVPDVRVDVAEDAPMSLVSPRAFEMNMGDLVAEDTAPVAPDAAAPAFVVVGGETRALAANAAAPALRDEAA